MGFLIAPARGSTAFRAMLAFVALQIVTTSPAFGETIGAVLNCVVNESP